MARGDADRAAYMKAVFDILNIAMRELCLDLDLPVEFTDSDDLPIAGLKELAARGLPPGTARARRDALEADRDTGGPDRRG